MNRPVLIATAGVVVIAVAIGMSWWNKRHEEAPPAQTTQQQAPAPAAEGNPSAVASNAPSFDIVRINPQGQTVIAGRAMPNAEVTILDGGKEIGKVTADARGEWVFLADKPLPPGSRELTLRAKNPDGSVIETQAPVVLVVPEHTQGASIAVKVNPDGSIDILQGPVAGTGALSITGLRYDPHGHLAATGTADPNATIQLYLDNRPLTRTQADAKGLWKVSPRPALTKEPHTVRADELGPGDKVIARVEVSFTLPDDLNAPEKITVIPGTSLWRIARKSYGHGLDYLVIYQANKDQIRNPDLIYPGQVFSIPKQK